MPKCSNCGQEISQEESSFFEGKCIDCVHGTGSEEDFKLITAIFMGFFGFMFLISSLALLLQIIFNSYLIVFLKHSLALPLVVLFLISIFLINFAIKKLRSPISL